MQLAALSDVFYIVVLAYIAAFMPWTAFSAKDFISDKWKSIRHTRHAGYINLIFALVPACYIVFYCCVQFAALDVKEGCAAIAALCFALLHGFRSAWGLWQLYLFRSWCADSIHALQAMGVKYRYSDKKRRGIVDKHCKNAWEIADEMLVNNTLVDNQITNGETVCHIKYANWIHLRAPEVPYDMQCRSAVRLAKSYLIYLLNIIFCFGAMVYESVRFSIGCGTSGKLCQVPNEPVEVWINWAIVFAAQGLREWMADFKVPVNPRKRRGRGNGKTGVKEWEERRSYFASEVLATCVMQLWPELDGGKHGNKGMEPMLWSGWKEESEMHRGRMVKEELLEYAISSGEGLPFGVGHKEFLHNEGEVDADAGYHAFSRQVEHKVGSLDVREEFCSEIGNLDVEMLEWLAIFLYLGRRSMSLRKEHSEGDENGRNEGTNSGDTLSGDETDDESGREDESADYSVDQASRNLSEQLARPLGREVKTYAEEDGLGGEREVVLPSFPLWTRWKRARSRNRHVLKVGEMVDVWLSMIAGDGLKFLLELNENWSGDCRGSRSENGENMNEENDCNKHTAIQTSDGYEDEENDERLWNVHKEVEKLRLEYQFGDKNCRCEWGVNYGMTFMGYRMEAVRSLLATWAHIRETNRNKGNWNQSFRRDLGELDGGVYDINRPCALSKALSFALGAEPIESNLMSRQLHTRLLWELQEHLEGCIRETEMCESERDLEHVPGSFEAIALCVLSFPSLRVDIKREQYSEPIAITRTKEWCGIPLRLLSKYGCETVAEERARTPKIFLAIEPVCGPQRCEVQVRFSEGDSCGRMNAMISICFGEEKEFVWEWWRDAFNGRLEGLRQWQDEHYMETTLTVTRSYGAMDTQFETYETVTKERFEIWKGWKPFRSEFCMFELQNSGLLKKSFKIRSGPSRNVKMGQTKRVFRFRKHKRVAVAYEQAALRVLFHGMSLIRESIIENRVTARNEQVHCGEDRVDLIVDELLSNAQRLSQEEIGEGNAERALLLFEAAIGEFGNQMALENCVDLVLRSDRIPDRRAVEELEIFVGYILPFGELSERRMGADVLKAVRGVVFKTCKKLVLGCKENVQDSGLSDFLQLVAVFGTWEVRNYAKILMDVMFCYSETFQAAYSYAEMFEIIRDTQHSMERTIKNTTLQDEERAAQKIEKGACKVTLDRDVLAVPKRSSDEKRVSHAQCTKYEIAFLEKAAEVTGSLDVICDLGNTVLDATKWGLANAARAKELYERAASGEHVDAMFNLGFLLRYGAEGVAANAAEAKEWWERAVAAGEHVGSMYFLGCLLRDGPEGVPSNTSEARKWFERAIAIGQDAHAMCDLARMLEVGAEDEPVDAIHAKELYERAIAAEEHVEAMNNLGCLLWDGADGVAANAAEAKEWFERAVAAGKHVEAMNNLGCLLRYGAEGVPANAAEAKEWWERAVAAEEHAGAMYFLGCLLWEGADGVAANAGEAKEWFERAVAAGEHVVAMYNLGCLLRDGAEGVPSNAAEAKEWFERAVAAGKHVEAMNNLGCLLWDGADGVAANAGEAKEWFERAVTAGEHVEAMNNLGCLLCDGADGVAANAAEAKEWWKRAVAAEEHAGAMYFLGCLLRYGAEGVPANAAEAKEWWERAVAAEEHAGAMYFLGCLLWEGADGVAANAGEAKEWWERAVAAGEHVVAMYNLGCLLRDGAEGVPSNAAEAKEWFERAVAAGECEVVEAMNNLGCLLLDGADGVAANAGEAKEWFERAVAAGEDVEAMYNLGCLLRDGAEGVPSNAAEAKEWFERAVAAGKHVEAMNNLGCLLWDGADGVAANAAEAKEWFERAVAAGKHVEAMNNLAGEDVEAMYNLGCLLWDGADGVAANAAEAKEWFERAVAAGKHVEAMNNLGCLLRYGADGVAANAGEAKEWFERAVTAGEHVDAMYNLGCLLQDGAEGVPSNAAEAKEWFERAVAAGEDVYAMNNLGCLLRDGAEGVPSYSSEAKK